MLLAVLPKYSHVNKCTTKIVPRMLEVNSTRSESLAPRDNCFMSFQKMLPYDRIKFSLILPLRHEMNQDQHWMRNISQLDMKSWHAQCFWHACTPDVQVFVRVAGIQMPFGILDIGSCHDAELSRLMPARKFEGPGFRPSLRVSVLVQTHAYKICQYTW